MTVCVLLVLVVAVAGCGGRVIITASPGRHD
jgi:hypothetical protein